MWEALARRTGELYVGTVMLLEIGAERGDGKRKASGYRRES
jgi:hypothetical protein